ncbi:hypothetical protein LWI28_001930 [Acer negundo]|uniref:Aspartic peptidase DDI1-type domain-containing protein n=1 Tax=Acer negundo TaxID=4023 RepID=A0AAD5JBV7_ACENE|nr:hypothetical protein LWI28_001930 [Acer negundo]
MGDEIGVLRRALNNSPNHRDEGSVSRIKVPKPKHFQGSKNAKELENFLWDMEQYFKAARIPDGEQKELKDQFLPCNTSWLARESLKKLKQTGSCREYVKDFSGSTSNSIDKGKSIENKFRKNKEKDWKKKADGQREKEKAVEITRDDDVVRANPIQLLNTMRMERQQRYGLMQVMVQVNGKQVRALLDIGADNNFLNQNMVDRLELNLSSSRSLVKAANTKAVEVLGVAKTNLKVEPWHGTCMVNVVRLDDFELILGNEFFMKANVSLMPYLRGILIGDCENPCFIQVDGSLNKQEKEAYSAKGKGNMALDRGKCVATLETKPNVVAELKREVDDLKASKVSYSGPVQFQRKQVENCSKLGKGP